MSKTPKVLLYDIENTPIEGTTWGIYEQDVVWVDRDWHLLSYAYKWLGEKSTHVVGLPDFPSYKKDKRDDKELVKSLHKLFDEADIVIAHNGDRFDQRKAQARMVIHDLPPPAPYRQIDTKKVAKRYFMFTSNKLDDLGEYLGVGHKLDTGGKYLWKSCMAGDEKAWKKMKRYNRQDVILLEKVYMKLRPWIENHPAIGTMTGNPDNCEVCGSDNLHRRGTRPTQRRLYERLRCMDCGHWQKGKILKGEEHEKTAVNTR